MMQCLGVAVVLVKPYERTVTAADPSSALVGLEHISKTQTLRYPAICLLGEYRRYVDALPGV